MKSDILIFELTVSEAGSKGRRVLPGAHVFALDPCKMKTGRT